MNTRFGEFGGQYIPEILMSEINHVAEAYEKYKNDPAFKAELKDLYANYTGRPSMLYEAKRMRADLGGPKIYLKREDLNHTGAHKINNCIGQALLAKRMGKTRLIAETGAGQHGVAAATIAALLGMECEIFMGEIDTERQALNVYRMRLLGAKVNAVKTGSRVLKDAVNSASQTSSARLTTAALPPHHTHSRHTLTQPPSTPLASLYFYPYSNISILTSCSVPWLAC